MNNKLVKKDKEQNIDLFWKSRDFKPWEKSTDWYWIFWIVTFSFILILIYFYNDYIFSTLVFLIALISVLGHRKDPPITEYRINERSIVIKNGKEEIPFERIESFNIDIEEGYIFINKKDKYKKLIVIPFETTHNITVIDKILSSKIKKDETLDIPFLEKIFNRMLGF